MDYSLIQEQLKREQANPFFTSGLPGSGYEFENIRQPNKKRRFAGEIFTEDPIEMFGEQLRSQPRFTVQPFQEGLIRALPEGVNLERLSKDTDDPLTRPQVERFLFNRMVLDQEQPFPLT